MDMAISVSVGFDKINSVEYQLNKTTYMANRPGIASLELQKKKNKVAALTSSMDLVDTRKRKKLACICWLGNSER